MAELTTNQNSTHGEVSMAKARSMTTDVLKQHTVPRFLLDNFGMTGKGKRKRFYAFDKTADKVFQVSILDATTRNRFYNVDDHPDKISLEPLLGIYESDAAPVINTLLQHRDIQRLTANERYILAIFVAIQRARSYSVQLQISHLIDTLTDKLKGMDSTAEQIEQTPGGPPSIGTRHLFLRTLLDQRQEADMLLQKDWYLYETDDEHPFYISDNPVTFYNSNNFGHYGNIGFGVKGIQIHLPLSSTLTLAMLCPSIREDFIKKKRDVEFMVAQAPPRKAFLLTLIRSL